MQHCRSGTRARVPPEAETTLLYRNANSLPRELRIGAFLESETTLLLRSASTLHFETLGLPALHRGDARAHTSTNNKRAPEPRRVENRKKGRRSTIGAIGNDK